MRLYLLGAEEEELAREVFGGRVGEKVMVLKKTVARKKQLVPPLMKKLS